MAHPPCNRFLFEALATRVVVRIRRPARLILGMMHHGRRRLWFRALFARRCRCDTDRCTEEISSALCPSCTAAVWKFSIGNHSNPAAEVQAVMHERQGGKLNGRSGPLHL